MGDVCNSPVFIRPRRKPTVGGILLIGFSFMLSQTYTAIICIGSIDLRELKFSREMHNTYVTELFVTVKVLRMFDKERTERYEISFLYLFCFILETLFFFFFCSSVKLFYKRKLNNHFFIAFYLS